MINFNNVKDKVNFEKYNQFCKDNNLKACRIESIESYFNSKKGA